MNETRVVPVELLQRVLDAFNDYAISVDDDASPEHRQLYGDVKTAIASVSGDPETTRSAISELLRPFLDLGDSRMPDGWAVAAAHAVTCPDRYAAPPTADAQGDGARDGLFRNIREFAKSAAASPQTIAIVTLCDAALGEQG